MIDCYKCKYYYVTWEKKFPHGCRAMKFKSLQFPSIVVFTSSGRPCLLYASSTRKEHVEHPNQIHKRGKPREKWSL